ncbi:MAG: methyltransferase domain-containing protein [Candidatus Gorgyraea atricola]|nr:methyltransferase domain-containing protein [Candidatus Gorgyraea atricola]
MKKDLLEILNCPSCTSTLFSLQQCKVDQIEVRSGSIVCQSCGASYGIESGIVNFIKDPSQGVKQEREAMDAEEYITDDKGKRYKINEETIERFKDKFLSMPEGDGSHFFRNRGSFQAIANISSRVYSTLDGLKLTGKEHILEIGACFSYASFKFAKKGCRVVAIDISNYLKVADLFVKEAYFDRMFCDMHKTPFGDETFDIIFGSAVLHHSKELSLVFKEMRRILKPDGRLVLINEVARGLFEKVHPIFEKMQKQGYGDTSYTLTEWQKAAYKGGFKNVRIDFLSLADDYITRHKNKDLQDQDSVKLRLAKFFKTHIILEKCLSFLLIPPRLFFRPKSWKITCY